jgi:hypothetical protein
MAIIEEEESVEEMGGNEFSWKEVLDQGASSKRAEDDELLADMDQRIRERYQPAKLAAISSYVADQQSPSDRPPVLRDLTGSEADCEPKILVCSVCEGHGKVNMPPKHYFASIPKKRYCKHKFKSFVAGDQHLCFDRD